MTKEELINKMLSFIDTQDGDYFDEWYATRRDYAASILTDFAGYLDVELVVPEYVPQKTKPEIDRAALLKELMPQIVELFDMSYDKYMMHSTETEVKR